VRSVLDFYQPVALLLLAVLQFIPDEDGPAEIVATRRDALAPGSYLLASHVTNEHNAAGSAAGERASHSRGVPLHMRDSAELADVAFTGMEPLPPGRGAGVAMAAGGDRAAAARQRSELLPDFYHRVAIRWSARLWPAGLQAEIGGFAR